MSQRPSLFVWLTVIAIMYGFYTGTLGGFLQQVHDLVVDNHYKKSTNGQEYDLVLSAGNLRELGTPKGWPIRFKDKEAATGYNSPQMITLFAITGSFNAGKTWILNTLEGFQLPSGVEYVTEAISCIKSKINSNLLWMDSMGSERPVSSRSGETENTCSIQDRLATDGMIKEIVTSAAGTIFHVVPALTRHAALEINATLSKFNGRFIVIHNYADFTTKAQVVKHIQDDIRWAFAPVTESTVDDCTFWMSHNNQVQHLVLAREGSPAGKIYNDRTFNRLRIIIKGVGQQQPVNLISLFENRVQNLLNSYLFTPGTDPTRIPQIFQPPTPEVGGSGIIWPSIETISSWFSSFFAREAKDKNAPSLYPFATQVIKGESDNTLILNLQRQPVDLHYLPSPQIDSHPPYQLYDTGDKWILDVVVPGVSKENVVSSCEGRMLVLDIYKPAPPLLLQHQVASHHMYYGGYQLRFRVPDSVFCQAASQFSTFGNGVYHLAFSYDSKGSIQKV